MRYSTLTKHFVLITASALLSVSAAAAAESSNLATVEWLKENIGKPNVLVLDASPTQFYTAKHIPGAHSVSFTKEQSVSQGVRVSYGGGVDFYTDSVNVPYAFQERPSEEMEALFQDWGVSKDKTIVMYDQGGQFYATRLFYSFFYSGFPVENLRILDGGLSKWEAAGNAVTAEIPAKPAKGDYKIGALRSEFQAEVAEVVAASGDTNANALVEGLGPDWHFGMAMNYNRPGHIPHAKMLPAAVFFNEDKTFKSAEDIRALLSFNGITDEQQIYTHCGGGIAGSVPFFAAKFIAGYPKVKHFPASQLGWLHDERELPFWTYDAPYILRDTDWLKWWGGLRTRTLGSIHVSIIDLRDAAQYDSRHFPFALNIPAKDFREKLSDTDGLKKLLGSSGVNPKHEAVIVSGQGITPDAALAFVALERLGQAKVSIFTDTLDTWAQRGNALSNKPTIVAEKTIPFDLNIPPVEYQTEAREEVFSTGKAAANATFPRVYLASGEKLPSKTPEGTVVHVPYSQLLDEQGKPKSAAEIWQILSKAGLPRFAEIVTVADDQGEAAANYVILKLMGYPSVQVLAS
ncbi:MAG TPA: rhodanese-like domain-containing protein [Burkholderiaceae bacterium]|nr:rhodanese-like domain-containing protein [Burkholderiaceae bacterium]